MVDLRSAGHGQRYVLGSESLTREDAIHFAYQLLAQLGRPAAELTNQQELLFGDRSPAASRAARAA